jgi:cbb3-type cytochrome oxidase maturation protein
MPTEIVFMLVGLSIAFALTFLAAFIWAVKSGQYQDCDTPALRILVDDKE